MHLLGEDKVQRCTLKVLPQGLYPEKVKLLHIFSDHVVALTWTVYGKLHRNKPELYWTVPYCPVFFVRQ